MKSTIRSNLLKRKYYVEYVQNKRHKLVACNAHIEAGSSSLWEKNNQRWTTICIEKSTNKFTHAKYN